MYSKNYLGFENLEDFSSTLIRSKDWVVNGIFAFLAMIPSLITGYMWDSTSAIYTLWALMTADFITGVWKSMRSKTFVSNRVFRTPILFLVTSLLLALSWHLSKATILFIPLPSLVYGGFCAVYLVSLCENLGELGYLPKPFVTLLKNRFGLKALIKRTENDPEPPKES